MSKGSGKRQGPCGEGFLRAFYRLVQTVKIHQDNNQLLMDLAHEFVDFVTQWCQEDEQLTIQISRGRFFFGDEKLAYSRGTMHLIDEMLRYFEQRGLQGLRFYPVLKDFPLTNILDFARLLNSAVRQENPPSWLLGQIRGKAHPWVEIIHGPEGSPQHVEMERKEMARKTYSYALASVKEVSQKLASQQRVGIRKIKRMVQNMVDLLMEEESLFLGMSTIRDYDDYTYTHSVNVAILSLSLGKRIGLSRTSLALLGICGLLHDLGKVMIPLQIINKPGKLSDEEFAEVEKHPLNSVRQIVKLRGSRDLKDKILLAPFEHHLKYDLSGYPRIDKKKPVSLFGRILTIGDVFDAITSPRVYRPKAFSPDRALGIMLEGSGRDFDPILLKVFINMLGIYPVGTLLKMDTGEMALVMDYPNQSPGALPRVLLLAADGHGGFKKEKVVNLSERDPQTNAYRRNVVKSLNPSKYGIQPAEFILS